MFFGSIDNGSACPKRSFEKLNEANFDAGPEANYGFMISSTTNAGITSSPTSNFFDSFLIFLSTTSY